MKFKKYLSKRMMGQFKNRVPKIGEKRQKHVKKTLFKT